MALEDILGTTAEIKIFDFLAENMDIYYNEKEISKFTGLSRATVDNKVSEMIYNDIIEIKEDADKIKKYQLADNDITKMLISSALVHSFKQADKV
jgi:DNA-binding transcriptional regulator LsrR (DeoR family)